jgi:hypothetical protein
MTTNVNYGENFYMKLNRVSEPLPNSQEGILLDYFRNVSEEISLNDIRRKGYVSSTGEECKPKNPCQPVSDLRKKGWVVAMEEREDDNYYKYLGPVTEYSIDEVIGFIINHKNPWVFPQHKGKFKRAS